MKWTRLAILASSLIAVIAVVVSIRAGILPMGVSGEWEWKRELIATAPLSLGLAFLGIIGFAGFAAWGMNSLGDRPGKLRETGWLAALFVASLTVQFTTLSGGPDSQGLAKWATLGIEGSSGYFTVAKSQMADPWRFWKQYPSWIHDQDSLHIGTHPPGLFLLGRGLLSATASSPKLTSTVMSVLPETATVGFRAMLPDWSQPEKAAIALMGLLTLLACAATVIPLYVLARSTMPASSAWAAAAIWPIAPAALMFQPTADSAFPFLATMAIASVAGGGPARALLAGVVLAIGMQFSLVFLPIGLIVAIVAITRAAISWRKRAVLIVSIGAGFLTVTLGLWWFSAANPFVIWWNNQRNHGRFYQENPRTYWIWLLVNPIELALAVGIPTSLFALVACCRRKLPATFWAVLGVLILLNLSGKNRSEVARLWLPFMPLLLLAAAAEVEKDARKSWILGGLIVILGLQTLAFQSLFQVVYPFSASDMPTAR
jgi:hypothetical protein